MESICRLPLSCPSCSSRLQVRTLACTSCTTTINGNYSLPIISRLGEEDQSFVVNFVKSSGSLKEMSKQLNLSYPSVRNMLDDIISKIQKIEQDEN